MRFPTALLLASTILSGSAAVADDAAPDTNDIRVVSYSPLKRTEIIGIVGQPTTITFPKTESIYRVVQSGKPDKDGTLADAGWQGADPAQIKDTPLGCNLTLWPVSPGQSTMSVITMTSDGVQHVYPFRMVAIPDDAAALTVKGVTLNLIFQGTTPDHPAAPPRQGGPVRAAAVRPQPSPAAWAEAAIAKERLRTDSFNGADGDCHYVAKGKRPSDIEPKCPIDNGVWTLMHFPGLSKQPAVYIASGEDGKDERLARQHSQADYVVVEEIAAHFRLRLGDSVLDIINEAYRPEGAPTGTGTTSPTVVRDLIQAKASR
jgi:type IV secretory pathway VirB9-like protein